MTSRILQFQLLSAGQFFDGVQFKKILNRYLHDAAWLYLFCFEGQFFF